MTLSGKTKGDNLRRTMRTIVVSLGLLLLGMQGLFAQAPSGLSLPSIKTAVITDIQVEGAQRVEAGTVISYMVIKKGDVYDPGRVDRSLKSLFSTGLFSDVSIKRQGNVLVVSVVENPVINRVAFEGNKKVENDTLESEISLRPRIIFTRTKVQSDVKRILAVYRANGRFAASVEPKVIQLPQNRIDLIFEINEGKATEIRKIRFIGNGEFSDSRLRELIRTKETRWWRFFTSSDTYDPDRLTLDRELLRRHYLKKGFADFRVISAIAELSPNRSNFFITFTVDEGNRYKYGDINVAVRLKGVTEKELSGLLELKKGSWYDSTDSEGVIQRLTTHINDKGISFVSIRPRINRIRDKKLINLTFDVNEGPRRYVERIDITGNVRTQDKVIRREFLLVEGDAFNVSKLRRSRQRIRNLEFFQKMKVDQIPGNAPDKVIIKTNVEEKSTGSVTIGGGFSTTSGALIDLGIEERNLLGLGQELTISATIAEKRNDLEFKFTEPYFLGRQVSAGADVFRTSQDLQDSSSFDREATGAALRLGYPITERLSQSWRYSFNKSKISDVATGASPFIQAEEGSRIVSDLTQALAYDTRDNHLLPTKGYVVRLSNNFAGLGGPTKHLRTRLKGARYYSIFEDWVIGFKGEAGYIVGLFDEDVRLLDRFFMGGETVRGFDTSGIGPRDRNTRDALGGEWKYNGSVEATFPLGLPNEIGIKGRLFTDFGSVSQTQPSDPAIFDSSSVRLSVGAGLTWVSPFGPIGLDVGIPVLKEKLDQTQIFRLNFGTRF
jgi:outer membrane protein insertion porin family